MDAPVQTSLLDVEGSRISELRSIFLLASAVSTNGMVPLELERPAPRPAGRRGRALGLLQSGRLVIALAMALYAFCGRAAETRLLPHQVKNWSQVSRPVRDPLDPRRNETKLSIDQIAMGEEFMAVWRQIAALWIVAVFEGRELFPPEVRAWSVNGGASPPHPNPGVVCVYSYDAPVFYCVSIVDPDKN